MQIILATESGSSMNSDDEDRPARTLEPQQNDAFGTSGTLGTHGTRFYCGQPVAGIPLKIRTAFL
jgi:hypothetical protein